MVHLKIFVYRNKGKFQLQQKNPIKIMRHYFEQLFEIQSIRMTHIADQQNHATHSKKEYAHPY